MIDTVHEIVLQGVRPEPLGSYLKGLGIIRLVAQQKEPGLRAFWRNDELVLLTTMTRDDLVAFFAHEYHPTPLLAPWNSRSGFFEKPGKTETAPAVLRRLESSTDPRLKEYRVAIECARSVMADVHIDKPSDPEAKAHFISLLRNRLPDEVVQWIDAVAVLRGQEVSWGWLLGTGANDGDLEFANNFMQRISESLLNESTNCEVSSEQRLRLSLFNDSGDGGSKLLDKSPVGQYNPGMAGGPNMTAGYDVDSLANPWDYVLLLEGTLLFSGNVVRGARAEESVGGAVPFFFAASAAASFTVTDTEESAKFGNRGEIWTPLWLRAVRLGELSHVFEEARADLSHGVAHTGLEFSIAIANLGTDSCIDSFVRYALLQRRGKSWSAVPLGRFSVRAHQHASLLEELVPWLRQLRRFAGDTSPASTRTARRVLEDCVMDYTRSPSPGRAQLVLTALVDLHRVLGRGRPDSRLRPPAPLDAGWIQACDDGSPEYALAFSVAAWVATCRLGSLRELVLPVGRDKVGRFVWNPEAARDIMDAPDPLRSMELLLRAILASQPSNSARIAGWAASPDDVAAFLSGQVDPGRTFALIGALSLLDTSAFFGAYLKGRTPRAVSPLPAVYCVLKPFFAPEAHFVSEDGTPRPLEPTAPMLSVLERHQPASAANAARMALVAHGFVPAGTVRGGRTDLYHGPKWPVSPILTHYLFAGLLFPVQRVEALMARCLRQTQKEVSV
jgi:CRISPR-associated protein Csx17